MSSLSDEEITKVLSHGGIYGLNYESIYESTITSEIFGEESNISSISLADRQTTGDKDTVIIGLENGNQVILTHDADCCESVYLIDEDKDNYQSLRDLVGNKLLKIEIKSNSDESLLQPDPSGDVYIPMSFLWTFVTLYTDKDVVQLRWFGESNGYYSEEVDVYIRYEPPSQT